MHSEKKERTINLNTILITIVLALGGWTLNLLSNLDSKFAGMDVRVSNTEVNIVKHDLRLATAETNIVQIQINAARYSQDGHLITGHN